MVMHVNHSRSEHQWTTMINVWMTPHPIQEVLPLYTEVLFLCHQVAQLSLVGRACQVSNVTASPEEHHWMGSRFDIPSPAIVIIIIIESLKGNNGTEWSLNMKSDDCESTSYSQLSLSGTLSKPDTSLNRTANLVHSLPNCTCISVTELSLKRTPL